MNIQSESSANEPTTPVAVKRSHSPDQVALYDQAAEHAKRARTHSRPRFADAYLECLSSSELIHIIRQVEQLLQDTPHAADVYALIYPNNIEERVTASRRELAASSTQADHSLRTSSEPPHSFPSSSAHISPPLSSAPPFLSSHVPHVPSPLHADTTTHSTTDKEPLHQPPGLTVPPDSSEQTSTPTIQVSASVAPPSPPPHTAAAPSASSLTDSSVISLGEPPAGTASRLYTPMIPASTTDLGTSMTNTSEPFISSTSTTTNVTEPESVTNNGNISSRVAAILESIQNTNSSGPMLGLQGQPLAPSKQGGSGSGMTSGLSSLLSNSFPNANHRMPANSALSRLLEQTTPDPGGISSPASAIPPTTSTATTASSLPSASSLLSSLTTRPGFSTGITATGTGPSALDYTSLSHATTQSNAAATSSGLTSSFTPTYGIHDPHTTDANDSTREPPRITSTLPSYEDMIIEGLQAIGDVNGTPPRMLFHWMEDTYPLMKNFRPSASQALQKAFKRGRLHKAGSLYRINPHWDGSNAGRKPTRRPQIGKDHPMMVNGPKGPAPASPFKARAQFEGAAAYRQSSVHLNRHRGLRHPSTLRPGPKPYGQPGAAPLDNPASSIFQNGAAAAALLLAHQQRSRDHNGTVPLTSQDLTPTLTSLVRQLRASQGTALQGADGSTQSTSSLSSILASALLKHAQRPSDGSAAISDPSSLTPMTNSLTSTSSPVLQSLSRLLGSARSGTGAPGSGADAGSIDHGTGLGAGSAPTLGMSTGPGPNLGLTSTAEPVPEHKSYLPFSTSSVPSPAPLPASGPGSLSASIETLVRQATRAATHQVSSDDSLTISDPANEPIEPAPSATQSDLDAAVSETLQAAFQEIGPQHKPASTDVVPDASMQDLDTSELDGINLEDYSDALRTLTAALAGTHGDDGDEVDMSGREGQSHGHNGEDDDEEAQRLADEKAIADAEADLSDAEGGDSDGHESVPDHDRPYESVGSNRMESLLRSYGIDVSTEAIQHLTETLRDPNMSVSDLTDNKAIQSGATGAPTTCASVSSASEEPTSSSTNTHVPQASASSANDRHVQPPPSDSAPSLKPEESFSHHESTVPKQDQSIATGLKEEAHTSNSAAPTTTSATSASDSPTMPLLDPEASDEAHNQSIQSQLEALIASLAADSEG